MSNIITDDTLNVAQPDGPERIQLPFSAMGDQTSIIVEQDFWQTYATWTPLPVNSLHPTRAACYLIEESPLMPTGSAGVAKWTRKYATVPITRNEGSSMSYQFPGLMGAVILGSPPTVTTYPQRVPFTCVTTVRLQYDYFLVGVPSAVLTFQQIPRIYRQRYFAPLLEGRVYPAFPPSGTDVTTLTSIISLLPTTPTAETYYGWMQTFTELVAEDCTLSRWRGQIYQRITKFIVAN